MAFNFQKHKIDFMFLFRRLILKMKSTLIISFCVIYVVVNALRGKSHRNQIVFGIEYGNMKNSPLLDGKFYVLGFYIKSGGAFFPSLTTEALFLRLGRQH